MKNENEEPTISKRLSRPHPAARIFEPEFNTDPNVRAAILFHIKYRKRHENKVCGCVLNTTHKNNKVSCTYGILLELLWLNYEEIEEQFS